MNILHINTKDLSGGAAISALRLHGGLKKAGHGSSLMVGFPSTTSQETTQVPYDWRTRWLHRIIPLTGLNYLEYLGSFKIPETDFYKKADILNLHNLHRDFFSYLSLPKLTREKPAVWTLHDMWPLTGHCAYSYDCDRWETGCGRCPYLENYPAVRRDATKIEWKLKNKAYSRSRVTIVVPSKWLEVQARRSMLIRHFSIHHIPHGLDTSTFLPIDKALSRSAIGLPTDKTVLMFAAEDISDRRKGLDLLIEALKTLPESFKSKLTLLTMGAAWDINSCLVDIESRSVGYIESDRLKALCFSAGDFYIHPARSDNFPLMPLESIACGTPVIGFDVGGVGEIVRNDITGLLLPPADVENLKEAIIKLAEDGTKRRAISVNCRNIAEEEYSLELQVGRYEALYSELTAG